ncbi:disease resistance protein SUMM2-like [Magnolia sinica]|uniref:disease resistance protein SUMM2-like n=1 Tax=Magnolia sinica TaxID=86752 RepID=UPI002658659A|nr:disease resistance protein SUMM2-like [Magnolia sinica]
MQELRSRESDVKNELKTAKIEEDLKIGRYFSLSLVGLGKLVIKKTEEVVNLKKRGRFSEGLLANLLPESESMPMTKLVGRTTAQRNLEQIWGSLRDHNIRTIGVYGMGGVGKTTIMTHIYNQIKSFRRLGIAIWVTVSNDLNIEKIQNGIAQAIRLEFSDKDDEMSRSMKLFEGLKHREKFVIIFDDVWKPFSLEKVGIPEGNAFKIVLTTRLKNVCRGMRCQKKVEVQVLSREEAWELFQERLGADVVLPPEVEPTAKLVTEECGGLPLGIITVARAMREKGDIREWRNALDELKCSMTEIEGMDDEVFPILKFSYDRLKSERIRSCFLYCALYPEDYAFYDEELIGYWIAEGLIDDMGDWEKELDKGHTILNGLIDVCMLVKRFDDCIVMHDLIRDLAISITRKSPRFVVKVGTGIRGSMGVEEFTSEVERISLMRNEIKMLLGQPNCPKLSTLLLQRNPPLRNISHCFFDRMNNLRVLNLSYTSIEYVPVSVSNLENLSVLLLNNCWRLTEVPSLAKLKRLRLLNLSNTSIKEVPDGMECLVNLKELYVGSEEWVDFDRYVRSGHWKCLKLVDLSSKFGYLTLETNRLVAIGCNFVEEESSSVPPDNIVELILNECELLSLRGLSRLQCLQKCKISFCSMKWLLPMEDNPTMRSLPSMTPTGSFAFLRHLTVYRCQVLESLMSLELFQQLQCLERIDIEGCSEMEEVIQGGEAMVEEGDNNKNNNPAVLPKLREFYLINLGKLKSVCKRVIICPSLSEISIVGCCQLKKLSLSLGNSTSVVEGTIEGSKEWLDALAWDDPNTKTLLLPLFQEAEAKEEEEEEKAEKAAAPAAPAAAGGGCGIKRKAEQQVSSTYQQPLSSY